MKWELFLIFGANKIGGEKKTRERTTNGGEIRIVLCQRTWLVALLEARGTQHISTRNPVKELLNRSGKKLYAGDDGGRALG